MKEGAQITGSSSVRLISMRTDAIKLSVCRSGNLNAAGDIGLVCLQHTAFDREDLGGAFVSAASRPRRKAGSRGASSGAKISPR